jgi:hypothetical protein
MKNTSRYGLLVMIIALCILLPGCRDGKAVRSPAQPQPISTSRAQPTSATVKIASRGTLASSARIGGVRVRLVLPKGVTVKATQDSGNASVQITDPGVVTTSGGATSANSIATYTAAKSAAPGTLLIHLAHATGFGTGEFVTVVCDVAGGAFPKKDDFSVAEFKAVDLNGSLLSGMSAGLSVDIR